MAVLLLVNVELESHDLRRTEELNKFRKSYGTFERESGIIDAIDSLKFDEGSDHDEYLHRLTWNVNNYIHITNKIPSNMRVLIYEPIRGELYVYDWRAGHILEVPRIYRD
jgi:hypothetical protein